MNKPGDENKPNFWQIVFSTLAAFFGIQSNKNRERDFKYGNIYVYIVSGLIFTIIFIFTVVSVVKLVLHNAGM
ncbi:MAG: DUF2970 domain-containing protein [Porticoccus sp.]|nr:DUF2970 domain-containing protein [Porticoccus sp.]MBQ0806986.1 DUF2970 domain-containing protein [Porticoccus sp.]